MIFKITKAHDGLTVYGIPLDGTRLMGSPAVDQVTKLTVTDVKRKYLKLNGITSHLGAGVYEHPHYKNDRNGGWMIFENIESVMEYVQNIKDVQLIRGSINPYGKTNLSKDVVKVIAELIRNDI